MYIFIYTYKCIYIWNRKPLYKHADVVNDLCIRMMLHIYICIYIYLYIRKYLYTNMIIHVIFIYVCRWNHRWNQQPLYKHADVVIA